VVAVSVRVSLMIATQAGEADGELGTPVGGCRARGFGAGGLGERTRPIRTLWYKRVAKGSATMAAHDHQGLTQTVVPSPKGPRDVLEIAEDRDFVGHLLTPSG
jgi:hypothetical protein